MKVISDKPKINKTFKLHETTAQMGLNSPSSLLFPSSSVQLIHCVSSCTLFVQSLIYVGSRGVVVSILTGWLYPRSVVSRDRFLLVIPNATTTTYKAVEDPGRTAECAKRTLTTQSFLISPSYYFPHKQ